MRQLLLLSLLVGIALGEEDVYSCGGFIKTDSNVKIDYSSIRVRLYTQEGNLKYETDCAPHNGYFMIPVYTKGHYKLRIEPPQGWHFQPKEVPLHVDGESDPCTRGEDINFRLVGFSVTGRVVNQGSNSGPQGYRLSLLDTDSRKEVSSTTTSAGGQYIFPNVLPGSYAVVLDGGSSCVADAEARITVAAAPTNAQSDIAIAGYALAGHVQDQQRPASDVSFLLLAPNSIPNLRCSLAGAQSVPIPKDLKSWKALCHLKSAADGSFVFPCVPPGKYKVLAHYSVDGAEFVVSPAVQSVELRSERTELAEKFALQGFRVRGSVRLSQNGRAGVGAEVLVDGVPKAKTAEDGSFDLTGIRSGKYKIGVRLDGYEFSTYDTELTPKAAAMSPFFPLKVRVCGSVRLGAVPKGVKSPKRREVKVTGGPGGPSSLQTEEDGRFCWFLAPGSYLLSAQLLAEERSAGVELVPEERAVSVSDAPVSDVNFRQFQAAVRGSVVCQTPCSGLALRLLDAGTRAEVGSVQLEEKKSSHQFVFTDLLPGSYLVVMGERSGICWADGLERPVTVAKNDVNGISFRQSGFAVRISTTNPASLSWESSGKPVQKGSEKLAKGSNSFCLPVAGEFGMRLESCTRFSSGEAFRYSTENPAPITLTATQHRVSGRVVAVAPIPDLGLKLRSQNGLEQQLGPLKAQPASKSASPTIYPFHFFAAPDTSTTLIPSSATFLFAPNTLAVSVNAECVEGLELSGYPGKFVDGRVEPAVADVAISLSQEGLVFKSKSDAQGRFRLGPLERLEGMRLEAEKDGYVLTHLGEGRFSAFKLSELAIQAVGEDGEGLEGVLISLSGGQHQYRSNNRTGAQGSITFVGLSPGDYFIRPVLKEFSFVPPTRMVQIGEGTAAAVRLVGKRVAFSAHGVVEHVGGEPVVGAVVAALGGPECGGVEEEGRSDEEGRFRIRGLLPGCPFTLRLRSHPDVTATIPPTTTLTLDNADIQGLRLLAAPAWKSMEISGRVLTHNPDWLKSCRLTLAADSDPDTPLQTLQLTLASTFYFTNVPIDNSTYFVTLQSNLPKSQWELEEKMVESVLADSDLAFVTFHFSPQRRRLEADVSSSGWIVVSLVALLALAAYKQTIVAAGLRSLVAEVTARWRSSKALASDSSGDSSPDLNAPSSASPGDATGFKRRAKTRKT